MCVQCAAHTCSIISELHWISPAVSNANSFSLPLSLSLAHSLAHRIEKWTIKEKKILLCFTIHFPKTHDTRNTNVWQAILWSVITSVPSLFTYINMKFVSIIWNFFKVLCVCDWWTTVFYRNKRRLKSYTHAHTVYYQLWCVYIIRK